jgi:hypothetical protein
MKSIQQIEGWIEAIESSNVIEKEQEQNISGIVDFWKFATTCDSQVSIIEKGKIAIDSEPINITTSDFILSKRTNPFEKMISDVEEELLQFGTKYLGLYSIRFHDLNRNFQEDDLILVKEEILSAIKGDVILYKYVYKLNKIPSAELKIFKNDLGVLECDSEEIQHAISKTRFEKTTEKQWLVLLLDAIDHNCNSFLFEGKIKEVLFESGYDKVFLFDFYKSEIIALNLKNQVMNRINGAQKSVNEVA